MTRTLLVVVLLATFSYAAQLGFQSGHVSVSSSDGSQLRTESLNVDSPPKTPLVLGDSDVLKLSFTVVEQKDAKKKEGESGGKGVQPHQTFLRFYDEVSGEEGIQPVRVGASGKAKFEINMSRPPTSLPPTPAISNETHTSESPNPLAVSLILGSSAYTPFHAPLFSLVLPPSQPAPSHADEVTFHPLPELAHTFRPDPKMPPQIVSMISAGAVLAPWLVLLGLWASIPHKLPHLTSPPILAFTTLLGACEGLLFWYWVDLKLGQVLAYGTVLGLLTSFVGNRALSMLATVRRA